MSAESPMLNEYHYPAGTVLFREGDEGKEMYILRSGRVELTKRLKSLEKRLAVILPGDFFGELSVMCNIQRTATARVVEDANLLVIDRNTVEEMIINSSEIAVRMIRKMAAKLAEADVQIELLLHMDAESRLVHALDRLSRAAAADKEGRRLCEVGTRSLALLTGLDEKVVKVTLERLVRAGLIQKQGDCFSVAPRERLEEYLDYLELRSRTQMK